MRRVIGILTCVALASACTGGPGDGSPAPTAISVPAVSVPAVSVPAVSAPPGSADPLAWQRLAPAPSARTEVAAAATGTRVYLAGGFRADGGTVRTVEVFDTATGRWSAGPDLPVEVDR